jgi:hypothetical protein
MSLVYVNEPDVLGYIGLFMCLFIFTILSHLLTLHSLERLENCGRSVREKEVVVEYFKLYSQLEETGKEIGL